MWRDLLGQWWCCNPCRFIAAVHAVFLLIFFPSILNAHAKSANLVEIYESLVFAPCSCFFQSSDFHLSFVLSERFISNWLEICKNADLLVFAKFAELINIVYRKIQLKLGDENQILFKKNLLKKQKNALERFQI